MPLAVSSYRELDLAEGDGRLNLAWTIDERDFLAADLDAVIADELEAEAREGLPFVDSYLVQDPYGEELLGLAVAALLGVEGLRVTCGAGVISLLHSLARLARGKVVHVVGETYPDFPFWVERAGGRCVAESPPAGADLVFLERPSLVGDRFADLSEVGELAVRAGIVVVDESNANYYPPSFSAAGLVSEHENVVVLRGLSKGYGLGGLRLAYCVSSPSLEPAVRDAVPPLLASSLSLRIGRRVLELGDVAGPLRQRIAAHKQEAAELLRAAGFAGVVASSEHLPYVLLPAAARERLDARGVAGKLHPPWPEPPAGRPYRLSAPLRDERMQVLREKLAQADARTAARPA